MFVHVHKNGSWKGGIKIVPGNVVPPRMWDVTQFRNDLLENGGDDKTFAEEKIHCGKDATAAFADYFYPDESNSPGQKIRTYNFSIR